MSATNRSRLSINWCLSSSEIVSTATNRIAGHGRTEAVSLMTTPSRRRSPSAGYVSSDSVTTIVRSNRTVLPNEPQPLMELRIRAVYAYDNHTSPAWTLEHVKACVVAMVAAANRDLVGTGIRLTCFVNRDVELLPDRKLRCDYYLSGKEIAALRAGDISEAEGDRIVDAAAAASEQRRIDLAAQKPDTLLWLFANGNSVEKIPADASGIVRWSIDDDNRKNNGSYSWQDLTYVALHAGNFLSSVEKSRADASRAVHEIGHYFGLLHTHREPFHDVDAIVPPTMPPQPPQTRFETWRFYVTTWLMAQLLAKYPGGASAAQAEALYDQDRDGNVLDTPADPGPGVLALAKDAAGSGAGSVAMIQLDVPNAAGPVILVPRQDNPMSYYLAETPDAMRFTHDQVNVMRDLLLNGHRRQLVGGQLGDTAWAQLRYGAIWTSGLQRTVWWPMCTEEELRATTAKLWSTMRIQEIHGYRLDGEVLYSVIWEQGTYDQVWWPNCSEQELRDKTGELWETMRPVQIHAFVVGDQVRYSCLWNASTAPVVWWPNCSEQELRDKTGELWETMRPVQIHAFVVGDQVRYSCLWNASTASVVWWPNCSEQELRDKTGELWETMRPAQIQPFIVDGQVRYSCLWDASTASVVWWPLCTVEQLRWKTEDLGENMSPVHWQPLILP